MTLAKERSALKKEPLQAVYHLVGDEGVVVTRGRAEESLHDVSGIRSPPLERMGRTTLNGVCVCVSIGCMSSPPRSMISSGNGNVTA